MSEYQKMKKEVVTDLSTSNWLLDAVIALDDRDICNVMRDIEMLRDLFKMKMGEALDGRV